MLTITESVPDTGYLGPSDDEMFKLAAIVRREAPWIDPFTDAGFARAHLATGLMFRLPDTDRRYAWHSQVGFINEVLAELCLPGVSGPAALAGIVGHGGEIPLRRYDSSMGQLLEVGLARFRPGSGCGNLWKTVLATGELAEPLPARPVPGAPRGLPMFRVA
jgi:hypothetical protein